MVEEICYSGKLAGHIEKSINCMILVGGGGSHWIWIHKFFFWHMYFFTGGGGGVGCHRLWSSCIFGKYDK